MLLRLVGFGGGTGGCLACGGTGGGTSGSAAVEEEEEEGRLRDCRGRSSTMRETVLGGLATGTAVEEELEDVEEAEDEDEEEEEDEDVPGILPGSVEEEEEEEVRNLGGSRACFDGGGSCCESCGAKRTPADSAAETTHTTTQTQNDTNAQPHTGTTIRDQVVTTLKLLVIYKRRN